MPIIPNFPPQLLEEHKQWHHERHNISISNPPPGYGLEFLQYHRSFIRRALDWYYRAGLDARLVEAWPSVPEPIRQSRCYDRRAEARMMFQPETFVSADELGRFLESSGVHGCIHERAAVLYRERELNDFDFAPRHTEFYRIHNMIDNWYQNWEGLGRFREGLSYWCGRFESSEHEVLYYRVQDGSWWHGRPDLGDSSPQVTGVSRQKLEWFAAGTSREFGRLDDGRPFMIRDADGDGRLEILFYDAAGARWQQGKFIAGRIRWKPIRPIASWN